MIIRSFGWKTLSKDGCWEHTSFETKLIGNPGDLIPTVCPFGTDCCVYFLLPQAFRRQTHSFSIQLREETILSWNFRIPYGKMMGIL